MEMEPCREEAGINKKLNEKRKAENNGNEFLAMDLDRSKQKTNNLEKIKKELKLGTWNVRGTYEEGALKNLTEVMAKYKLDVLAIQETKQTGNDITPVGRYTLFKSGNGNRFFGTGFMVSKRISKLIVEFKPISERLCYIRLRGKYRKISIVNVHAPTEDKDLETKNEFYEKVEEILRGIPRYDIKLVIGDLNAKVGREDDYKNITGGKSLHKVSNQNGMKMIEFASENQLKICSTAFDHKDIHKVTWVSPDGKTKNQIDHVMIENRHSRAIRDCRSYRGADANSDHFLVVAILQQNIPKEKKVKRQCRRYNTEKLKDHNVRKTLQNEIEKRLLEDSDVILTMEEEWLRMETTLKEAAEMCLGNIERKKRDEWFDETCKNALEKRNKAKNEMDRNRSQETIKNYNEERKRAKMICRQKKREYLNEQLKEVENYYAAKETRNFYQHIKKSKQPASKALYCRDKDGLLLGETSDKLNRWAQYFDVLLNEGIEYEQQEGIVERCQQGSNDEQIKEPTYDEFLKIITELKNNKSPGENGVTAEIWKEGGEKLHKKLFSLILQVWNENKTPSQWNTALICPILKKGDKTLCHNYRGISLLDVAYKILAKLIRNRLRIFDKENIGDYQGGFRAGRSTIDQIFTLKGIQDNSYEQNLGLHLLFIDFKQAYDTIKREKIYEALTELGIPNKLRNLIKMTLSETKNKILLEGHISNSFHTKRGLRQGDPIATDLFNIVLEQIVRKSKIQRSGLIYHHREQCIAYADDVVILARSIKQLKAAFKRFEEEAKKFGLIINEDKTKYMEMRAEVPEAQKHIVIQAQTNKYKFEKVEQFEYLGVTITNKNQEECEIDKRTLKGSRTIGLLTKYFKAKEISRKAKIRIYETIIRPITLYGCETWIMTGKVEKKLEIWERKVLRKIFGGVKTEEGEWRRRTNREIMELYGRPKITRKVRAQRARWLGHVYRMPEQRCSRKVLFTAESCKRKRGRPKKKWLQEVQKDLEDVNVTDWKKSATNRTSWKQVVEKIEAKGLQGL